MSTFALKKIVLPSLITSGILFAAMTIPLGIMGEEKVGIKFQEESLFDGRLRDAAAPYVILATVLSFGTGISLAALAGWQHSSRKSLNYKNELSQVKENLQFKEELLQELHLSESRLQASGLNNFLEERITQKNFQEVETFSTAVTQLVETQASESISEPVALQAESSFVIIDNPSDYKQHHTEFQTNNNTILKAEETAAVDETNRINSVGSEFEELQRQFQDMMSKMQQMQQQMKKQSGNS